MGASSRHGSSGRLCPARASVKHGERPQVASNETVTLSPVRRRDRLAPGLMKMWESRPVEAIMTLATAVRPFRAGDPHETMIDRSPVDETLREMAELPRDARPGMLVSGVTVAAVTVGVAGPAGPPPRHLHHRLRTLDRPGG